ncbi:WD-40 repeat-containing protein [Desulfovibrio sp. X2]|uniref:WD40 repeat domain-containing protein n=1 Tax=Desulfovibrio sp. X2 TaxID=941449 RepID=UPI000358E483|nr:WD40 repeat domain-containing protein [Desulfovibrio sp. X2]EPR41711.1 WD-40 repeat-containing protein [Desulfovibrio sp. X2]
MTPNMDSMEWMADENVPGLSLAQTDAYVTACAFAADGESGRTHAAFSTGDGRLLLLDCEARAAMTTKPHEGAILSLATMEAGFLSGGDDGRVVLTRTAGEGAGEGCDIYARKGKWIEHLAVCANGRFAATLGREVLLFEPDEEDDECPFAGPTVLGPLPANAAGLASGARGRILYASHNGGLTMWDIPPSSPAGRPVEGEGAHLALTVSPDGRFAATATPDKAVRILDLQESEGFVLEGYPIKVESLAFDGESRFLMTSGEQAVVMWDLGAPPEKRGEPIVFGAFEHGYVRIVAPHPALPLLAAGYDTGAVFLGDSVRRSAKPLFSLGGERISCLAWSPDGRYLCGGNDEGALFLLDLVRLASS